MSTEKKEKLNRGPAETGDVSGLAHLNVAGEIDLSHKVILYLDDVSVTPVAAGVPGVPDSGSTGAMMLLGVLGLGVLAHRWRNPRCA